MIRFEHVSKNFSGHSSALSDITVEIKDGEFVFLIGPSGAGKTTFLRLLIRDQLPSEGKVFVDDWEIGTLHKSRIHLLRRKIGMVFQDFKLLMDRTVYENVALGLDILGKKQEEIDKRVLEVLDLVGLSDKHNLFPLQLAAGEMQRTGIARAIVGAPSILLADEPTGNLDQQTASDILTIFQQINSLGTTVIMATHNAGIVNDLKKRTIALKKGVMVSDEEKGRYRVSPKVKEKKSHEDD